MDLNKCNLNGSGISIGHPIGCTGARITYTLAMQMKKNGLKHGLASLCIGGGQGMCHRSRERVTRQPSKTTPRSP